MPHLIPDRKVLHGEPLPGRIAAGRNNPMPHFSSQDLMPITAQLTPRGREVTYPFLSDLAAIRQRTRQHIRHCAETPETNAATEAALRLLHDALAIELGHVCRNCSQLYIADGSVGAAFGAECPRYSKMARHHVKQIAARISQLGVRPNFTSNEMVHLRESACTECDSLADRIEEDLIAEHIVVECYRDILQFLGVLEPITRRLVESILAAAQRRLAELIRLREQMLRESGTVVGAKSE
jgi:bacterioferritin